jgi:acetoin utilization protein AcuB
MRIDDWMVRPVHVAKPLDTVLHVRELMTKWRVNQLPVVRDGELVGIVTDRDLRDAFPSVFETVEREFAADREHRRQPQPAGSDPARLTIDLVMTHEPFTLSPEDSVEDAASLMRRKRVGAVPIVEGGKLVGILTRSDVLDAFLSLARSSAEAVGA